MKTRGFTLIEIMVVISVIGILASGLLVYIQIARVKAADSARDQQLTQIDTAVQLYKSTYDHAPDLQNTCFFGSTLGQTHSTKCIAISTSDPNNTDQGQAWSLFKQDLSPFLKSIPNVSCIVSCSDGGAYIYVSPAVVNTDKNGYSLTDTHEYNPATTTQAPPVASEAPTIYDLNNGFDTNNGYYVLTDGTANVEGFHIYDPSGTITVNIGGDGGTSFTIPVPTTDNGHGSAISVDIPVWGLYSLSLTNSAGTSNAMQMYIPEGSEHEVGGMGRGI